MTRITTSSEYELLPFKVYSHREGAWVVRELLVKIGSPIHKARLMSMSNQNQGSGGGGFRPFAAPNIVPAAPQAPSPAAYPTPAQPSTTVAGTLPFTTQNSTNDKRVLWEDGNIAIIFAGDFPANTGMGRSKSRKTLPEALAAQVDPGLTTGTGAGSKGDLVKVYLAELLARPIGGPAGQQTLPVGRLAHSPSALQPKPPSIAKSGAYKGMVIPDFPHKCTACGGPMYQGMFEAVHSTPDGQCPAVTGGKKRR